MDDVAHEHFLLSLPQEGKADVSTKLAVKIPLKIVLWEKRENLFYGAETPSILLIGAVNYDLVLLS